MSDVYLMHDGTPHEGSIPHSGRYPYGSGENPGQHSADAFLSVVNDMRKQQMTEKEICTALNMSSQEYRNRITISSEAKKDSDRRKVIELKEKGYSNVKIGEELGLSEGTIRNYLKGNPAERKKLRTDEIADVLKKQVEEKGIVDVGKGVELEIGCSDVKLNSAIQLLKDEGYYEKTIPLEQMTNPGNFTNIRVLAAPGTTNKEVYNARDNGDIQSITEYDVYGQVAEEKHPGFERTKYGLYKPTSVDSDRVYIRYGDEGGLERDGTINIRRGVEDLSLGKSNYAQVRIAVDGTHYLKGVALYSDDIPDGYDIVFNTNKMSGTPMEDVLKPLKNDPDNPFKASIKTEDKGGQRFYIDKDGKEQLSPINIVNAEGDWGDWNKTVSSQMLSKQPYSTVKKQLDLTYEGKIDEFNEIMALTNPEIKRKFLYDFADECDSAAVHLKATAFPRQAAHLILPVPDMPEGEIYAPNYKNGETVCLIRYPHAGVFEIPELVVNNNFKSGKEIVGLGTDAVGINYKTAAQLSGADFDGDTVMVIPVSKGAVGTHIHAMKPLEDLKDFSTDIYAVSKDSPKYDVGPKTGFHKQMEMGKVSNLITDMTLLGAPMEDIAKADKHSMVIIDAEKHHLDWKQSALDNNIAELKRKWQGGANAGASTLISRSSSVARIDKRKTDYSGKAPENEERNVKEGIDVLTGEKVYKQSGETYGKKKVNKKTGEVTYVETPRQTKTTKMALASDATELLSIAPTPVELEYANYANNLKALGNKARKEYINTETTQKNKEAATIYAAEVKSLNDKLVISQKNAPRERQAQLAANAIYKMKLRDDPSMSDEDKKKIKSKSLAEQRVRYDAKRQMITFTDSEWEAVQAGAISSTKLQEIMRFVNPDDLRARAMPKEASKQLTDVQIGRIKSMAAQNGKYSIAQIAEQMGISTSTVSRILKE